MRRSRFAVLACALLAASGLAVAQETVTLSSVDSDNDGRPVSALIGPFRQSEGIAVSYEDPRYRNAEDIQDVTEQVRGAAAGEVKNAPRILVPKGPPMRFVYSQSPGNVAAAFASMQRMLEEYNGLGGPTFSTVRRGNRIFVVPLDVKDGKGNRVVEGSILETHISLPAKERSGAELLAAICDAVERVSGFRIDIGTGAPTNGLVRYRTNIAFADQPARAILVQLLDSLSKRQTYVWDLYFGPGENAYALNFAYIENRAITRAAR